EGVVISYATLKTRVGLMMVGATERGICFSEIGSSKKNLLEGLRAECNRAQIAPLQLPRQRKIARWIDALRRHLAAEQRLLELPLDLDATAFQIRVWTTIQSIPYGEVQSYGEIAAAIGKPGAARAVARACASCPLTFIIPCHRVIRESGAVSGFGPGVERRRKLLKLERTTSTARVPR
ncbi:MAG TPA: methylated-DNA--[protein]-cysteine S-methyltransferase, partial [Candidatus Baltobacteraceae bacterium]